MGRWPPMRTSFPSPGRRRATPESRWCSSSRTRLARPDAAALVRVDYEPRPAAIGFEQALAVDTPRVWDDRPGNVSFEWEGDAGAVEAAFARAAHVTRVEVVNNRIAPVFMEPRSAVAEYDPGASRWTLRVGCQSAHGMRAVLVHVMGIGPERLRVVVPDTGGGFGARAACTRSTRCCWLPPGGWGDPSSGRPSARRRSWPITRRAITCCAASWPSTATADSRQCARASTGATAPI